MISKINHICRVRYARISEVSQLDYSPTGGVIVKAAWQELNLAKVPSFTISQRTGKAGRSYESNFQCSLTSKRMEEDPVIVLLNFSDGNPPLLVGTLDHPVWMEEDHSLVNKTLRFTHEHWAYPFTVFPTLGGGIFDYTFDYTFD